MGPLVMGNNKDFPLEVFKCSNCLNNEIINRTKPYLSNKLIIFEN